MNSRYKRYIYSPLQPRTTKISRPYACQNDIGTMEKLFMLKTCKIRNNTIIDLNDMIEL